MCEVGMDPAIDPHREAFLNKLHRHTLERTWGNTTSPVVGL